MFAHRGRDQLTWNELMTELYRPSAGEHPITPPPELLDQWCMENNWRDIAIQAAQWGADQELEACCQALRVRGTRMRCMEANQTIEHLRAARRRKPPSLKEQALEALEALPTPAGQVTADRLDTIRRAIEQLPD